MRTTITFASDVAAAVQDLQHERGQGVSETVNELIRRGLMNPPGRPPFRQTISPMGESVLAAYVAEVEAQLGRPISAALMAEAEAAWHAG